MTEADYCICTLPLPTARRGSQAIFRRPRRRRSPAHRPISTASSWLRSAAFLGERTTISSAASPGPTALNENVIYPSGGIGSAQGRDRRRLLRRLDPSGHARIVRGFISTRSASGSAANSIEALHPGRSHLLAKPVTVAWGLTPYSEGVGALWPDPDSVAATPGAARSMQELLKPEGPIVFAGEHLSYQPTWQEGAALRRTRR